MTLEKAREYVRRTHGKGSSKECLELAARIMCGEGTFLFNQTYKGIETLHAPSETSVFSMACYSEMRELIEGRWRVSAISGWFWECKATRLGHTTSQRSQLFPDLDECLQSAAAYLREIEQGELAEEFWR